MHRSYEIGGVRLGIRTTSEAFGGWLDQTLSAYRSAEKVDPVYSVIVADDSDGALRPARRYHILWRATTLLVRTFHLPTLGRALLSDLESLQFAERDDAIYARAGVVAGNSLTALVPSTLISHVAFLGRRVERAGLTLPAELAVAIDLSSGMIVPIRPALETPGDALARLALIAPPSTPGDRLIVDQPAEIELVCAMTSDGDMVQPISRAAALYALASEVWNLDKLGGEALEGLGILIEEARCYGLRPASARETLTGLSAVLQQGVAGLSEPEVVSRALPDPHGDGGGAY